MREQPSESFVGGSDTHGTNDPSGTRLSRTLAPERRNSLGSKEICSSGPSELSSFSSPGPTRDARLPVVESDSKSSRGKDSVLLNAVTETTHLGKPKPAATILPIAIERMVYSAAHTVRAMH